MKNILVTGGAGFIGSNYVRYLLDNLSGVHIYNLDLLTYAGSQENLQNLSDPSRHNFIQGDICDRDLVEGLLRSHTIDTIVHFAAETHVDRSIHDPASFIRTNINGTFTLLESARQVWLVDKALAGQPVRFHHVSTDEVYGALLPGDPPFRRNSPYQPNSPYSASKAASDHLVRAYHHTYGLPATISNCTNNYGPNQFPEKLIPLVVLNAASGKQLPVYGDGQQVRDWLYVYDHCEAIKTIIEKGTPGETYNIGGENQPANLTVISQICSILDEMFPDSPLTPHRNLIRFVPDRPGHDRRYDMDTTKIRTELGWQPRHSLGLGLQETVSWYVTHPDWVTAVTQTPSYQAWINRNYLNRGEK